VTELKHRPDNDLVIQGSGQLIQTLTRHDLIDAFMLVVQTDPEHHRPRTRLRDQFDRGHQP
jgi:dihydrofolate reductase